MDIYGHVYAWNIAKWLLLLYMASRCLSSDIRKSIKKADRKGDELASSIPLQHAKQTRYIGHAQHKVFSLLFLLFSVSLLVHVSKYIYVVGYTITRFLEIMSAAAGFSRK